MLPGTLPGALEEVRGRQRRRGVNAERRILERREGSNQPGPVALLQRSAAHAALVDAGPQREHPHHELVRRHFEAEYQCGRPALHDDMLDDVQRQRGLAHRRAPRDNDEVSDLQAAGHVVQVAETGIDLARRPVAAGGLAQHGPLAHDARVGRDVRAAGRGVHQVREVGDAADLVEQSARLDSVRYRHCVQRLEAAGEGFHCLENDLVPRPAKVASRDDVEDLIPGFAVEHDAAQHATLGRLVGVWGGWRVRHSRILLPSPGRRYSETPLCTCAHIHS